MSFAHPVDTRTRPEVLADAAALLRWHAWRSPGDALSDATEVQRTNIEATLTDLLTAVDRREEHKTLLVEIIE